MVPSSTVLWWLRLDLRLTDNAALAAAIQTGAAVIPVYIWAPDEDGAWSPGGASRVWLHGALADLNRQLHEYGSQIIIIQGPGKTELKQLAEQTKAKAVYWNRCYEPTARQRDAEVEKSLQAAGIGVYHFNSTLLHEPDAVHTQAGGPYQVFTPFWKASRMLSLEKSISVDLSHLHAPKSWPDSLPLSALNLLPKIPWHKSILAAWDGTASGARQALSCFADEAVTDYPQKRDYPEVAATSRLSPYLHFGQIGPRQIFTCFHDKGLDKTTSGDAFLRQVFWREFAFHLLHHFPETPEQPLRPQYHYFPWQEDERLLRAWQNGRTGYPIVDAGMRELYQTGWMHNRVRMIAASLLVKHLLQPWQAGAAWFWDTLVDADLANNTLGWQWTAGCGADAAPYFRVFNPILQGIKFDPQGRYVRRFVPELSGLPNTYIHKPWEASPGVLKQAGVTLGQDYPKPLIDHSDGRRRALEAWSRLPKQGA